MSRNQRKWVGKLTIQPLDPDLVLSRHMKWVKDPQNRFSTLDGAEPDNLTCASAWQGQVPDNALAREAFVYRDKHTDLWIQAVPWNIIADQNVVKWNDMQRAMGAVAVWYNGNAKPLRRRKTYAERELTQVQSNEITHVDILHQTGKFKLGDVDLVTLVPNGRPRSIDIDIMKLLSDKTTVTKKRYNKLEPGQKQRPATKPVRTPLGVFPSVNAASEAHGFSASKMSVTINSDDGTNYKFISQDEYLKLTEDVNKQDYKM